ncbi:GTPase-activating protein GCS1 PWA37_001148 [Arxiozyma heterogenica]|uniref:Arf-GAP domain-containing protein n=1 Tax=Arxiozyma heterogenica TaxID=278026 RepID=A0AAN7WF15_9SACH|nr:hypothetical protein RI543_004674 [Kazachstania heterogenica]
MSDWKVDPDHRRRLLQLQKIGDNKKCVDCHAPNPQWASPKFGIFICLECAGIHRSLGVHISFVRSITMDQFKDDELLRMEKGGNANFNDYMSAHGVDLTLPQTIKYNNVIAEDYKEKLTCEVEGKAFVEPEHPNFDPSKLGQTSITNNSSQSEIPLENRRSVTPKIADNQKEKNEAFFARLGEQNQAKPEHLPPSQGGKYQGFGSTPVNPNNNNTSKNGGNNTLSLENLQADPLGTLSRGWNLFSSAVSKSVNDMNETVIKPKYEQWQSGELSEETKRAAAQFGQKFHETSSYGYAALSKFTKTLQDQYYNTREQLNSNYEPIENSINSNGHNKDSNTTRSNPEKTKDDKWDDF